VSKHTPWNKGKHVFAGENNPMYGRHHSLETKRKMSETLKNQYKNGRKVWSKGKHGVYSEEARRKMSRAKKGSHPKVPFTSEHLKELWTTPEFRAKMENRKSTKGLHIWHKHPHPRGMLGKNAWNKGLIKETDAKIAKVAKKLSEGASSFFRLRKDPEFMKHCLKALLKRPTKPEKRLINVIQKYGLPYDYVGDGKVIIEGKCPDFINNNGAKRIIEVFGDVYHNPDKSFIEISYQRTEQGRKELFAKYGFETLILWDSRINQMSDSEIAEAIREFEEQ